MIATYFFISIALIFFNKLIMTPQTFPFPLTVSWVQFAVALVCIIFFRKIGEECVALPRLTHSRVCELRAYANELSHRIAPSLSFLPPLSFNMSIAVKVAPVTGIFVAMIVFNNLCLQYVEVSFYQVRACVRMLAATLDHHTHAHAHAYASNVQVARAWTTILTIAFAYFLLNESTSVRVRTSLAPRMHSCNRSNQRTERTNSLDSTGPHCLWSGRGGIRAGKLGRGESLVDRCDVRHGVEHLRGAVQHLRQEGDRAAGWRSMVLPTHTLRPRSRLISFRFVSFRAFSHAAPSLITATGCC